MAEQSYPRPGYNAGGLDSPEYVRLLAAESASGLVGSASSTALVYADNTGTTRVVKARASRYGYVRGVLWTSGGSDLSISLAANSTGAARVDIVVLRLDLATRQVT